MPRLNELGLRERLDEVVGGSSSEFQRIVRLRDWVAAQFPTTVPDPYPPWDALIILDWIRSGITGGYCGQYAQIFLQSLAYLGIPARYVEIGLADNPYAHFLTEVWSREYDKWVLMDPNYNVHFERGGVPLSALEIHAALVTGAAPSVTPVLGPTRDGLPSPYDWPLQMVELFYYLRFDLKSDHLANRDSAFDRWNDFVEWHDSMTVPWELSTVPSIFEKVQLTRVATRRVEEPYARPEARQLASVDGTAFFAADDGTGGMEPWRTDGRAAGTALVADIHPGGSSNPDWLTRVNGTLFFRANDGTSGVELWASDGTPAGTVLVKDINPGAADSNPASLVAVDGTLFFTATDGTTGIELWKSDGTEAGTVRVADIVPGPGGSVPFGLTSVGARLFFRACGGPELTNCDLWTSDGTAAGTVRVTPGLGPAGSDPSLFTPVGDRVFFAACEAAHGCELWTSDGTPAGTVLVKDVNPGPADSNPRSLVSVGGTLLFTATDGTTGVELWRSDGTEAGTARVTDLQPGPYSSGPRSLTALNGRLFFLADDGSGAGLWTSDGTADGTRPVATGFTTSFGLISVGDHLFFGACDVTAGCELWASNGTRAGTARVSDIHPGAGSAVARDSSFRTLGVNGTLVFAARDDVHGYGLWAAFPSDGPIFADVPVGYWAKASIEALHRAGVTGGCAADPLLYCPDAPVTREQMAVLLLKMVRVMPGPCTAAPLADVPCSSLFAPWVSELVSLGITSGCGGGNYCPGSSVTREQMAVFLLKTLGATPPACATAPFADVPCSSPFAPWVQELVTRGITAGCAATAYCPTSPVTRAQMAVFLVKTFGLPFPAPDRDAVVAQR